MTITALAVRAVADLTRRLRGYAEYRRRMHNATALHALSDDMLKDCGISRCEIDRVALHGRRSSNARNRVR